MDRARACLRRHSRTSAGPRAGFKLKPEDLKRSKRFCAEDRGFLSEAGQFPFRETVDCGIRSRRQQTEQILRAQIAQGGAEG